MESISQLITTLKHQFDINKIEDYQSLLLIIYNSFFKQENEVTPEMKYELFSLLEYVIDSIDSIQNNFLLNNSIEKTYNLVISNQMQEIYIKENNK